MTIDDFANFCNLNVNLLRDIETGKTLPSIYFIQSIVNHTQKKIQFKII